MALKQQTLDHFLFENTLEASPDSFLFSRFDGNKQFHIMYKKKKNKQFLSSLVDLSFRHKYMTMTDTVLINA